jgi:hypothetical protein
MLCFTDVHLMNVCILLEEINMRFRNIEIVDSKKKKIRRAMRNIE